MLNLYKLFISQSISNKLAKLIKLNSKGIFNIVDLLSFLYNLLASYITTYYIFLLKQNTICNS